MATKTDKPVLDSENLTPAQKAARTRAANKAAKTALAAAPADVVEDVTEVVDNITAVINNAESNDQFIAVVQRGTPSIPAAVRNGLYTAGIVLGVVSTVAGPVAAALTGEWANLATSVGGVALALSNLLAKLNLSKTADDLAAEADKAVG